MHVQAHAHTSVLMTIVTKKIYVTLHGPNG